jgi:hypothetical protein
MSELLASALENYSFHLNLASNSSSSSIGGDAIIAVLAAILGFVSAYAINQIQRRQEPRKQLSWELHSEQAQLQVSSEIEERVSVLYRDTRVKNLTAVSCTILNTGNRSVKNEQIRFNFGDRTNALEHSLYPPPEPELGAVQVDNHGLTDRDFVYRIGQLEVGEQVGFLFVLASQDPIVSPAPPHATNEEGDVKFIRRGIERIVADQEHLRPFLLALFAFIVIPLTISPLINVLNEDISFSVGGTVLFLVRLLLLVPILLHLVPVARLTVQIVGHYLSPDNAERALGNEILGGSFHGPVLLGRDFADIKFPPPDQTSGEGETV